MGASGGGRGHRGWSRRGAVVLMAAGLIAAASAAWAQTPEVEPNDTPATANPIVVAGVPNGGFRSGAISPAGDVDVYSVDARAGDLIYALADGDPEHDASVTDLVVELIAPDGVTVLLTTHAPPTSDSGDLPFVGLTSRVQTTGTHYVRVRHFDTVTGTGTYTLRTLIVKERALVTGAGGAPGGGPHVRSFEGADGASRLSFYAYDPAFHGGAHVATCDLNRDGYPDIVTGAGAIPGGGPHVRVFNGVTGDQLPGPRGSFYAYDQAFTGGVFVACADVNGDGVPDIITGAGPGGGPHVKVFDGGTLALLHSFYAYDPSFAGGVAVAAGDLNGDGHAEVVTGAGPGGLPHLKVFDGATLIEVGGALVYPPAFTGGVFPGAP
jgi:FG-GAP-like repeat/FG-GAP repeat